jgi:hypothetical protein
MTLLFVALVLGAWLLGVAERMTEALRRGGVG